MVYTIICHYREHPELAGGVPPDGLLTTEETAAVHKLKTGKRRQDWLAGRYAAKHLLQRVFQKEVGVSLPFTTFAILKKENGAPFVSWPGTNGCRPVSLSISHAGDLAFCALLLQADAYLGCDIEQLVPRSALFMVDYFTIMEQALVTQAPADQQTTLVNAIWSGKEAALKALQLGLSVDTRAVTCLPEFGRGQGWWPLAIRLDARRIPGPVPALAGRWRVAGPYVLTLVAPAGVFAEGMIREMEYIEETSL